MSKAYFDLDLHGVPPEPARVSALVREAAREAQRKHVGLRIIHGRGERVMAGLVQQILAEMEVEFEEGVLNPGETRVEPLVVQRSRW